MAGIVPGEFRMDPRAAMTGMVAGYVGGFLGFILGGAFGFGLAAAIVALLKDPPLVVVLPVFFGSPIGGIILGTLIGRRLRKASRHNHGVGNAP